MADMERMEHSNSLQGQPYHLKNVWIPLVLVVSAFVCFSIPVFLNGGRLFLTDHEVFIKVAEHLRTRFSLSELSPLNEKFQTSIIDSKQRPYVSKHQGLTLQYPPGQSILLAVLRTFLPISYNLIECLIGAFGVMFFYFLVKHLLGPKEAIFCSIVLISTPIYFFWSLFALADLTAFVFLLITILAYLKARETDNVVFYIVFSLCLGATIWCKLPSIILIAPFSLHYLITRKKGEKWLPVFIGVLVFCVCIIALLFYHKWAFDGFLTTGYNYNELKMAGSGGGDVPGTDNAITKVVKPLLKFPVKRILRKFTNFPIHAALCSPLTLVGIFGCFSLKRKDWGNFSLLFLIALTFLGFYSIFAAYGVGWEHYFRSTVSSYHRYILPAYCLLMIPASLFFRNFSFKKIYMILAVIMTMNLSSLVFSTINLSNLHWMLGVQKEALELQQKHLKLTSDESIIIGQHVIFYMTNTNRHLINCEKLPMKSSAYRNEIARVVPALLQEGHDVYLVQDCAREVELDNVAFQLIDEETSLYKLKLD